MVRDMEVVRVPGRQAGEQPGRGQSGRGELLDPSHAGDGKWEVQSGKGSDGFI